MKIKLAAPLQTDSIVDGEGIRTVIWTQGCAHKCKGCHNPETHDFNKGFLEDVDNLKKQISSIKNQDGVTLSGGDPMYQIVPCKEIAKYCKKQGLNVWCYTGFTFEELQEMMKTNPDLLELLENIDVLVDGRFEIDKKSLNLHFKGSENQRILDVKESLKQGKAVTVKRFEGKKHFNNSYNHEENELRGIFI